MDEGTKFQITVYDKKDKVSGIMDYVFKEVSGNTATMSYEMQDEKGKRMTSSEYGVLCNFPNTHFRSCWSISKDSYLAY